MPSYSTSSNSVRLGETTEVYGGEHLLTRRARSEQVAIDHVERGDDMRRPDLHPDPRQRRKTFRATERAVAVHVDHRLLVRIDAGTHDAQAGVLMLVHFVAPDGSATRSRYSGTRQRQPSS